MSQLEHANGCKQQSASEGMRTIYPNVHLGKNVIIDEFAVVGYPPKGKAPGELPTYIGDNTHIRSHTIIYAGTKIGANCNLSHRVTIREDTTLGDNTSLGMHCIIEHHCIIGNNVRMQGQSGVAEYSVIEDDVWIGPHVVFTNVYHPTCTRAKECLSGVIVRKGAILGAGATICPDLELGANCFIGAGAVVTKAVEENAVMFGNPARRIETTTNLQCRYDMMDGTSPYARHEKTKVEEVVPVNLPKPAQTAMKIPLVDLAAQHQNKKLEIRLAMDQVVYNTRFINGKEVKEFTTAFAEFCGVPHCVGVSSGTDALVLALKALNIGAGDEVITTPHTFIATAEAILNVGATPVFVDIQEDNFLLDAKQVEAKITPKTKAIVPVHLYGRPQDMDAILEIARRRNLKVINDAAQAHGAEWKGKNIAQLGDLTCFSFYPGKNLGAYGDAGAVVTSDAKLAAYISAIADHGRTGGKYTHELVGSNYRLDTLQAAVLKVKLGMLTRYNDARRAHAKFYREQLKDLPLRLPDEPTDGKHVYHLFVIRHPRRDELAGFLKEKGVATGVHYPIPLHLQPALKSLGYQSGQFPVTERVATDILSLPMYPELSKKQLEWIIAAVREFCGRA